MLKIISLITKRIILFTVFSFLTVVGIHTYFSYVTKAEEEKKLAFNESKLLTDYMFIHREYYINLYATKAIKLDSESLKGLPAYSARPIAEFFSKNNDFGFKIKLASDNPRNPDNLADKEELRAIDFFNANRGQKEYFELIKDVKEPYYQYGFVLNIKKDCLVCHSTPQNAPKFIAERYKKAYGYKLGDLRGIISIKVPQKHASEHMEAIFADQLVFNIVTFIVLFIVSIFVLYNKSKLMDKLKEQTQKAQNANQAKSEFLANMSHEIRTPLNAILGFIDILKEENKYHKSFEYIDIIDKSSQNLLQIIEDILDFSKIESGKLQIDKIDFDARLEFQTIGYLFEAKCSEKNINLSLNIDKNVPQFINSDPLRIKQIIANLLSNAIKFTSSGKKITVDIKYESDFIYISVTDQGKGIAANKLEHIFESFSQADSSTTREHGGTGLGLTISSELAKLLGGTLKVKSEIDVGSKFYFSIPVGIGEAKEVLAINTTDIKFINKKILLVEDNKPNQLFMQIIFKKINLEFDIANDGLEAVKMYKSNKYDAILMDENMPNLNGIGATKQILDYEKENMLPHTPIIALTANALKGDREKFLAAGIDEYLTKPIKKEQLTITLNNFLNKVL